jgi:hypothetical protein
MADVLINETKFGVFNSPLEVSSIVQQQQHQANGEFCETLQKEVRKWQLKLKFDWNFL